MAVRCLGKPGLAAGKPSLGWLVGDFLCLGAVGFGGPVALVGYMQRDLVERFGWLTEQQFLDAVAVAMITSGPVVITMAFIGFPVAGRPWATVAEGGAIAGAVIVLA